MSATGQWKDSASEHSQGCRPTAGHQSEERTGIADLHIAVELRPILPTAHGMNRLFKAQEGSERRLVGLPLAFLIGLFALGVIWVAVLIDSVLIGASGVRSSASRLTGATQGRRGFHNVKGLEASRYAVRVDAAHAEQALKLSCGR